MISKPVPIYPPEIDLMAPLEASYISFEVFFWCISMCIATFLIILIMSTINFQED